VQSQLLSGRSQAHSAASRQPPDPLQAPPVALKRRTEAHPMRSPEKQSFAAQSPAISLEWLSHCRCAMKSGSRVKIACMARSNGQGREMCVSGPERLHRRDRRALRINDVKLVRWRIGASISV
jgi:hypothetical protein